jgi:hypothetical protein
MKKLILTLTAVAGFSVAGFSQGAITLDGSLGGNILINGVVDTTQDLNAILYGGTSPTTVTTPIITLLNSSSLQSSSSLTGQTLSASGDIQDNSNGTFYDNNGNAYIVPNVPSGSTGYFELVLWTGNGNSPTAPGIDAATSTVFSEVLVATTSPIPAVANNLPSINLVPTTVVPEPSTLAMAGVGLASMLFFRRKNK